MPTAVVGWHHSNSSKMQGIRVMSVLNNVGRGLGLVKELAGDVRQFCFSASAKVVAQGNARLGDVSRLSAVLGPQLRQMVDERLEDLQQRLDELNCSLAEKAVPGDRRDRVKQLSHSTAPNGRTNLRVVPRSEIKSAPAQGGAASEPKSGASRDIPSSTDKAKAPVRSRAAAASKGAGAARAEKSTAKAGTKSKSAARSKSVAKPSSGEENRAGKTNGAASKSAGKASPKPAAAKRGTTPRKASTAKKKTGSSSDQADKK